MRKNYYIPKIIGALLICILLINVLLNEDNFIWKIFILLFLFCSICVVFKNIFLLLEKDFLVGIFNKLYLICFLCFWFGFLGYSTYISIINNNYSSIILLVPFYLMGVFIVYKKFIKKS